MFRGCLQRKWLFLCGPDKFQLQCPAVHERYCSGSGDGIRKMRDMTWQYAVSRGRKRVDLFYGIAVFRGGSFSSGVMYN